MCGKEKSYLLRCDMRILNKFSSLKVLNSPRWQQYFFCAAVVAIAAAAPLSSVAETIISTHTVSDGLAPVEKENFDTVEGNDLFSTAEISGNFDLKEDPTVKRRRIVEVNFDKLGTSGSPAQIVQLNVFDNASFIAQFDRSETNVLGSQAWVGHLQSIPLSQAVLVETNGVLSGSVSMPGASYQIRRVSDNVYSIEEIDQSAFPDELPPIPAPSPDDSQADAAGDDACTAIKVLVAYTPEARAADGGTSAIQSRIALAVTETNQSYINSGMTQRIVLAGTIETSSDDAANNFTLDLAALTDLTDGKFNNVDSRREALYADMVSLIIEDTEYCGYAYVNSTASSAFSVADRICATGYYSFGHELGHNMGARHDWYIDDTLNAPYSYSKGYLNKGDSWRTIMGYNNSACGGGYCTRLPYWSNPAVPYGGDAMGVASTGPANCIAGNILPDPSTCAADNHLALNNTCSTVANFRQDPVASSSGVFLPSVNLMLLMKD